MDTRKKLYFQGFYHSFFNFWYSQQNHSENTNTIIFKVGGKKNIAEALSNLSNFFDTSSQIWFLLQILLVANYLHLFFERGVLATALTAVTLYLTRRCPSPLLSCTACCSQVSLAGISPSPQETAHKPSTVGKMKITTAATRRKFCRGKSNRSPELNTDLLHILSPR